MKNYKYIIALSFVKIVGRIVSCVAVVAAIASVSIELAITLAASFAVVEVAGFLMAYELEKIQKQATEQLVSQLQEDALLNSNQEKWN